MTNEMTNEEAIKSIQDFTGWFKKDKPIYKALEMAIKALEQEPCDDAISREELLKAIDTWDKFGCNADTKLVPYQDHYIPYIHYDDVIKCIKGMPSVRTQEPIRCKNCIHNNDCDIQYHAQAGDMFYCGMAESEDKE